MDQNISQVINDVDIVSEGKIVHGDLTIGLDGRIAAIHSYPAATDRQYPFLLPGVIDAHVHFREPGLTQKADIASESQAAAAGGVTYVLDMPNVKPTTTTLEALAEKDALFKEKCLVNYGIWYGITSDNIDQALSDFGQPDSPYQDLICGFKVFLGSSTGGMLMNDNEKLRHLFSHTQRVIGIHSESEDIIRKNANLYRAKYPGQEVPIRCHPLIRSTEACMQTTRLAVKLAEETGAQLHVCHLTTQEEMEYINQKNAPNISTEACVAHLWFTDEDYITKGALIKCNPAIKSKSDREALRQGLNDQGIFSIATDHAPHLLSDKQGGALSAASGMPSVQFSLVAMLELVKEGILSLPRMVQLMCEHPAQRFALKGRGSIQVGNFADLVLVDPNAETVVTSASVLSKCGWTPFEHTTFHHRIMQTWVNGKSVYINPLSQNS